tara:strand:+ start:38430 stop:39167 length:738 start_codon:yes stop_codon:yes gene_type:complete
MKNIFITGGLTGMGQEVAKIYKSLGYNIGICSFEAPDTVNADFFTYYQADVTDKDALKKAIESFKNTYGSLDIVFANAGINHPKQSIPDWDRVRKVIDVNIMGVINTLEPSVKIMKEQGSGQIVTVASVSAFSGLPGMAGYGASKSFVLSMSETLAIDLKDYGISVTTIAPGFIKTPLIKDNKHKMPFLMEQSDAAKIIVKAVSQKRALKIFPTPMYFVSSVLKYLPRAIYRKFMSSDILGLRAH